MGVERGDLFDVLLMVIALLGIMFSLGTFIQQFMANMYGFWFWFSLSSCLGFGLYAVCLYQLLILKDAEKENNK